jgi:hypothetical protein
MEARYPLFAEQFIAEAMTARPAYYAGEDPYYDAGRPGGPPARE